MLNNFMIVGRIINIEEETINVKSTRPYKNQDGEYESDTIIINVKGATMENIRSYCKTGDLIGAKGRIENGNTLVAEKVTFLSSSKGEE